MKVKIYSIRFTHKFQEVEEEKNIKRLEDEVNKFLSKHKSATVQFLQNSTDPCTRLTAVISFR